MDASVLVDQIRLAAEAPLERLPQDPGVRKELASALSKLTSRLEHPVDRINRFLFQPHQNAVIRVALALNLFDLVTEGEKNGTSAAELESLTGAEQILIVRIMRVLTSLGIFAELSEQRYAATPISKAWTAPPLKGCTKHLFDEGFFALANIASFLDKTNYRNPVDNSRGLFQFAFDTDLGVFDFIKERPERLDAFNTFMEGQREGRTPWFDYFPFNNSVYEGFKNEEGAVLMVDVGGGRGHDMIALKNAFPDQRGSLVVQDLPETIDEIHHLVPGVEAMKYDFFTSQPIKGARSYYFRSIFHDWPDDKCRTILRNTVNAAEKGYSRFLINEWVLLDQGSPWLPAAMDINMMAQLSGMERTEGHWRELLGSVGLNIVKIWGLGPDNESLIEAALE